MIFNLFVFLFPGGWSSEPLRLKPAEPAPLGIPEPNHLEAEVEGRVSGVCNEYSET